MFRNTVFTKLIRQRDDRRSEDIIEPYKFQVLNFIILVSYTSVRKRNYI